MGFVTVQSLCEMCRVNTQTHMHCAGFAVPALETPLDGFPSQTHAPQTSTFCRLLSVDQLSTERHHWLLMKAKKKRTALGRRRSAAFGVTLRRLRQKNGLSQERLAFESGLDRTYISLLERGFRSPTLTTVHRLASPLRISSAEFVRLIELEAARQGAGVSEDRKT